MLPPHRHSHVCPVPCVSQRRLSLLRLDQADRRLIPCVDGTLLARTFCVVDAIKCAVGVQEALARRDTDVPDDRRIQYRIGINLGDIVIDGDDIRSGLSASMTASTTYLPYRTASPQRWLRLSPPRFVQPRLSERNASERVVPPPSISIFKLFHSFDPAFLTTSALWKF